LCFRGVAGANEIVDGANPPSDVHLISPEFSSIPNGSIQPDVDHSRIDGRFDEPGALLLQVVPEPSTALLVTMGLILIGACGTRARRT